MYMPVIVVFMPIVYNVKICSFIKHKFNYHTLSYISRDCLSI